MILKRRVEELFGVRHHHLAFEQGFRQSDRAHSVSDYGHALVLGLGYDGRENRRTQFVVDLDEIVAVRFGQLHSAARQLGCRYRQAFTATMQFEREENPRACDGCALDSL